MCFLDRRYRGEQTNAEIKVDHDRVSDEGVGSRGGGVWCLYKVAQLEGRDFLETVKTRKMQIPLVEMPATFRGEKI